MSSKILTLLFLAALFMGAIASMASVNFAPTIKTNDAYAQSNQANQPSYFISIHPSTFSEGASEYSAPNVAVPIDTTVVWVNNDLGLRHTITSGMPGGNDSGSAFDSGAMPFGAQFPLTFNSANGLVGEFPYYCTIHPWMTAKISANDTIVEGQSFEFRSGTGQTLDLGKNNRTLLAFTPIGMSVDQEQPMYYNFSITRDSDNETLFANEFEVEDNDFEIELIQFANISQFNVANNNSVWFGPDVSVQYTGAYHAAGDFFAEPGNYTLAVEMTRIGSNPPPQQMSDEFDMRVVS